MDDKMTAEKRKLSIAGVLKGLFTGVLAVLLAFLVLFKFSDTFKNTLIKEASKLEIVRNMVGEKLGDDFEEKLKDKNFDEGNVAIDEKVAAKLTGYTNIALFGLDSRHDEFEEGTHSDSIIILSINNDTNSVKMASVYRDTMLKVVDKDGDAHYVKANQGFFRGSVEGALSMLNTNLDLDIKDYVVINFSGLAEIIDEMGGIYVNITEKERYWINFYLKETRKITGMKSKDVSKSGKVRLNGLQATSFCRIRYTKFTDDDGKVYNDDMGRTARQRFVLTKLVKKAKKAGVGKILELVNVIKDMNTETETFIKTSLDYDEIMDLVPVLMDYNIEGTTGFPFTLDTPTINRESMVVAQGLSYNVEQLHKFLFDDEEYQVSEEVQEISDYIINYTGIRERRRPEETESESESE